MIPVKERERERERERESEEQRARSDREQGEVTENKKLVQRFIASAN